MFFLAGCNETPTIDINRHAEIVEELNQTEAKLEIANNEIKNLQSRILDLEKEREDRASTSVLDSEPAFYWLHDSNWNEIVITDYYYDYDVGMPIITEYRVDDAMLDICPSLFFFGIIHYTEPPDPGPNGLYKYTFIRGSEIYTIDIYDSHCFNYDGTFYYCVGTIDDFAKAFVAEHGFISYANYIEFIYNSNALVGDKICPGVFFFRNRIQQIAKELTRFREIPKPNIENIGDQIGTFSFLNHGEKAKMLIYDAYINIVYRNQDIWLEGESPPISLIYILGAN